jgi:hypothetical protein
VQFKLELAPVAFLKVPMGQGCGDWTPATQKEPAGQGDVAPRVTFLPKASTDPPLHQKPARHKALGLGEASPVVGQYWPGGQRVHSAAEIRLVLLLYVPRGQPAAFVPVPPEQKKPAGQGEGVESPVVGQEKRGGHAAQVDERVTLLKVPTAQAVGLEAVPLQDEPIGHSFCVGVVAPPLQKNPGLQTPVGNVRPEDPHQNPLRQLKQAEAREAPCVALL